MSIGGLQIPVYKLFLLPFVVVIGASSALAKEPFYPDYTPRCDWGINKGAQQKLNLLAMEYKIKETKRYWAEEDKSGFFEDEDTKRIRLGVSEAVYDLKFGLKLIDLKSHARRKYKCDLNVTIPRFPL